MYLKRLLLTAAWALCLLPAAFADTAPPLASGLDFAGFDPAVRAQDDLFRHVNGHWLDSTPFPPEYPLAGIVLDLYERSQESLHTILVEAAAAGDKAGGVERKLGDFYTSFLDEQRVEDLGVKPLQPLLDDIASIASTAALSRFLGRARGLGLNVPVGIDVYPDKRNSGFNVAYLGQSGLGLPEREYYLNGDAKYVTFRAKYVDYLAKLLTLAGIADGLDRANRILALETRLATDQWTPVQNRDPVAIYNRFDVEGAGKLAPGVDWLALLPAAGIPAGEFIIEQPSYFTALGSAMNAVPLPDWRDYLTVRAIGAYARVLPTPFVEASFDFNARTLHGTESLRPRWKRAVSEVNGSLGDALGQVYVARHFPPEAKARMDELVSNLLATFAEGIDKLDWMGPETQKAAHEKLARMNVKIGYPDKWRDYSGLEVRRDDLFGNVMRSNQFEWDYEVARAGKPKDPTEWFMTPQTVNAYYMPMNNEIVFPAAYLQPPIFDMNVDDAANYGGIGSTIGHEISHAFDDKGRQYDGDGNLRDWWTAEDAARFNARAAGLIAQYSGYVVVPGLNVNGELTLGENIGDLSGLTVAYRAYQRSLHGKEAPVIDGLTGDQRFFLSHAQINRAKWREGLLREVVLSDPHAPDEFRTNGVVSNMNEFYAAFGLKQGDKLWLPAAQRVSIW